MPALWEVTNVHGALLFGANLKSMLVLVALLNIANNMFGIMKII